MKQKLGYLVFILIFTLACSSTGASSSGQDSTLMAIGVQQTQNAQIQETIQAATAQQAQPVEQAAPTQEIPPTATIEVVEAVEPTQEPVAEVQPTEEAVGDNHFSDIANLVRADDADYFTMDSTSTTWTDKNNFWEQLSGQEAGNYVLSAKVSWQSPQDMDEPARYGCGFIYGKSDPTHFHITVVSPDQKVHTFRKRGGEEIEMKGGNVPGAYLGVNSGSATLMVVVENKVMTAYVDGAQVVMFNDPYIDYGKMGLAINDGSYSGFTCSFDDIEIWVLK